MPRLHMAAAEGNIELIKEYLMTDSDVNDRYCYIAPGERTSGNFSNNDTVRLRAPLHIAAYHGHLEIVRLLVEAGAKKDLRDMKADGEEVDTALEIAIARQNFAVAKILHTLGAQDTKDLLKNALERGLVETRLKKAIVVRQEQAIVDSFASGLLPQELKEKLFFYAIELNAKLVVELMLKLGMSATVSVNGKTALQYAIFNCDRRKGNSNYIENLFQHGSKITELTAEVLLFLSKHGHVEELKVLIKHGLHPTIVIDSIPLMEYCFRNNRYDLVYFLIESKANIHYINEFGQSYLHRCKASSLAKKFIESGIDIYLQDSAGKTAAEYASSDVAQLIESRKQNPDMRVIAKCRFHKSQSTVEVLRQLVVEANRIGGLKRLQQALQGANKYLLNQFRNTTEFTVLHEAFWWNQGFIHTESDKTLDEQIAETPHTKAIDLLISNGAVPLKNNKGQTPLMYLQISQHNVEFVKTLIKRYASFEARFYGIDSELYEDMLLAYYECKYNNLYHPEIRIDANLVEFFWKNVNQQRTSTAPTIT